MISLKDYAHQKGISYEAVRKQVSRYKDDLEGHIVKIERTQYLDDEAVAFLDDRRASNPIIIMEQGKDDALRQLQKEKEELLLRLAETQSKLIATQELLLASKEEIARLTAENGTIQAQLESAHGEDRDDAAVSWDTAPAPDQKPGVLRRIWNAIVGG